MILGSQVSALLGTSAAPVALANTGADSDFGLLTCKAEDQVTIRVVYTGKSATSRPSVRVRWVMDAPGNVDKTSGSKIVGGAVQEEIWQLPAPGNNITLDITLPFECRTGYKQFAGAIFESGDLGNPGVVWVQGWKGKVR